MNYTPTLRDKLAVRVANLALMAASPTYRAMLAGAIKLGLETAAREEREAREAERRHMHGG